MRRMGNPVMFGGLVFLVYTLVTEYVLPKSEVALASAKPLFKDEVHTYIAQLQSQGYRAVDAAVQAVMQANQLSSVSIWFMISVGLLILGWVISKVTSLRLLKAQLRRTESKLTKDIAIVTYENMASLVSVREELLCKRMRRGHREVTGYGKEFIRFYNRSGAYLTYTREIADYEELVDHTSLALHVEMAKLLRLGYYIVSYGCKSY